MDNAQKLLSDITVFGKYAKYIPSKGRRETYDEVVGRNLSMHLDKYPEQSSIISKVYQSVYDRKVLPSMRSMQFSGEPIERNNGRIFNCAFMPAEHIDTFSELMYALLGGTGMGYSVQSRHISQLPVVTGANKDDVRVYTVHDSIEGWADAIKMVVDSNFLNKHFVQIDVSEIREKGADLVTTGGKAPGPTPLLRCIKHLQRIFNAAKGRRLKSVEVHDACCHIADAVLTGGIRRAAMICLFDRDDEDMLGCKIGQARIDNPQRERANNSAVLPRGEVTQEEFKYIIGKIEESGCGEPGVYWTDNPDWGTNPCCEIALPPYTFCNLSEINMNDVQDQQDLNERAFSATIIGTCQAGYTNLTYLRPVWKEETEKYALIGVGMTGIASGTYKTLDLTETAELVCQVNLAFAKMIGINQAHRCTTVKPSGTSSLVLGTSSGIHAWHNDYYIRRMQLSEDEAVCKYLLKAVPELMEVHETIPNTYCVKFPQKAPDGAIIRTESMQDLLDRIQKFNKEWVHAGHIDGDNRNNVSCTVSVRDDEWGLLTDWMWNNRADYNGIAVLPYWGGTGTQLPFEDIDEAQFIQLSGYVNDIEITEIVEDRDNTNLTAEQACAGGTCDLNYA